VSRHGKRRRPRGGEPSEAGRYPPPPGGEPESWDRPYGPGTEQNPHYTEPEWYRRNDDEDQAQPDPYRQDGFGEDAFRPEQFPPEQFPPEQFPPEQFPPEQFPPGPYAPEPFAAEPYPPEPERETFAADLFRPEPDPADRYQPDAYQPERSPWEPYDPAPGGTSGAPGGDQGFDISPVERYWDTGLYSARAEATEDPGPVRRDDEHGEHDYRRHAEHHDEQATAAFDPFRLDTEPEPDAVGDRAPAAWDTSVDEPLDAPAEPLPTRRDRRVQQRKKPRKQSRKDRRSEPEPDEYGFARGPGHEPSEPQPADHLMPEYQVPEYEAPDHPAAEHEIPAEPRARPERARRPEPEPLETDDLKVVGVGTILWGLAFAGLFVIRDGLEEDGRGWLLWSCLAGFGLGLLGLWYVQRRRNALAQAEMAAAAVEVGVTRSTGEFTGVQLEEIVDTGQPPEHDDPVGYDPYAELAELADPPGPDEDVGDRTDRGAADPRRDAGPDPYAGHWEPPRDRSWDGSQDGSRDEQDDPTPVTGEIIFDDPPRPYRQGDPPSFRRADPVYPPEEGYGRGWDGHDPYRSRD
jgi:hypothetical protein